MNENEVKNLDGANVEKAPENVSENEKTAQLFENVIKDLGSLLLIGGFSLKQTTQLCKFRNGLKNIFADVKKTMSNN